MNKSTLNLIWKLLLASLLVGLLLDFLGISPIDLIHNIPETVGKIIDYGISAVKWGGKYVLLGAIIVVPVWIFMNLGSIKNIFRRKN